ncbi:MAG: PA14 domain-containing protein [Sneathiella sp.]
MTGLNKKANHLKTASAIALCLAFLPATALAGAINGLKPASPQPAADSLKPGLAVQYYGAKFNSIDKLVEWMDYEKGTKGTPIPQLNYQVGNGNVLTTTATDLMGADITGFINFERSGNYTVMVHSNDGVRLTIGDKMIHEDPDVHADRFSDEITLEISEPGWYPVRVLYFEKKGTATLELYWDPPGPEEIDYVPAKAFAHIGK